MDAAIAKLHADDTAPGWACTDCLMLLANGETPPDLDETATEEWVAEIDRRTDGYHVAVGGEHDDECPNVDHETGQWLGTTDCYCETEEFSWSQCDVCGSRLGGSRHAVTFFPNKVAAP